MIYIYSLHGCPYSEAAEQLILETKVPHKVTKIYHEKDKQKYKNKHGMQTFPQIFFKNSKGQMVKVGGYEEFANIVELCKHLKK